jgi:cytochrome c2
VLRSRRAASLQGADCSPAPVAAGQAGLVWNAETLDRHIADPDAMIPEGRLGGVWTRDPQERRALIDWLLRLAPQ